MSTPRLAPAWAELLTVLNELNRVLEHVEQVPEGDAQ